MLSFDLTPPGYVHTFGLACRLEALRRLLGSRDARARRLAVRLTRMRTAGKAPAAPKLNPDRSPWGYWHVTHAQALVEDALSHWREPG